MTFEYMLKNNTRLVDFKMEITNMMKDVVLPAYSNLSLCYWKMERWNMVITFANQVLQSDSANVKNIYRRGIARKMLKMYD